MFAFAFLVVIPSGVRNLLSPVLCAYVPDSAQEREERIAGADTNSAEWHVTSANGAVYPSLGRKPQVRYETTRQALKARYISAALARYTAPLALGFRIASAAFVSGGYYLRSKNKKRLRLCSHHALRRLTADPTLLCPLYQTPQHAPYRAPAQALHAR